MTSDEFRAVFNAADHILPVKLLDGTRDLAVGLNGDKAVLHKAGEIPLDLLAYHPFDAELVQMTD